MSQGADETSKQLTGRLARNGGPEHEDSRPLMLQMMMDTNGLSLCYRELQKIKTRLTNDQSMGRRSRK